MHTEHGDVTKPRQTLVRTRAFSGENSPPMKFTFLGTSHFFVAARDDFSEIACSSGETDGEIIRN